MKQLMYPESIAFWGASNNPMKMGTMQLANVLETGFAGDVYPIHPTESAVLGLPAFRSIAEVGRPVDLAQLTLPTDLVPGVLDECGRAGIRRAIVISGGFKEVAGEKGRELEREVLRVAREHGIRFLGPNCVGVFNSIVSLNSTTIPRPPAGGRIAFASQSGAYTAMMNPYLWSQGIRTCQTISVGNEADIDLVDCLDFLAEEPEVNAVGLYIETVRRPREFIESARETARRKPVVAVYVGGGEAGSRSSLSHTGALTGPEVLYEGLLRQAGVMIADDLDRMMDMLHALSLAPLPAGGRMAVVSNSGGPGTSLANQAEKAGLAVPLFSDALQERLKAETGKLAYVGNPIDLTFEVDLSLFERLIEIVFQSGEVDGAMLYGIFGWPDFIVNLEKRFPALEQFRAEWEKGYLGFLDRLAAIPEAHGKPLIVMSFSRAEGPSMDPLIRKGVPVYPSANRCARAMKALVRYRETRD
ncbi:MAG: CoA-binding protein [Actinomycetota bacterium]